MMQVEGFYCFSLCLSFENSLDEIRFHALSYDKYKLNF